MSDESRGESNESSSPVYNKWSGTSKTLISMGLIGFFGAPLACAVSYEYGVRGQWDFHWISFLVGIACLIIGITRKPVPDTENSKSIANDTAVSKGVQSKNDVSVNNIVSREQELYEKICASRNELSELRANLIKFQKGCKECEDGISGISHETIDNARKICMINAEMAASMHKDYDAAMAFVQGEEQTSKIINDLIKELESEIESMESERAALLNTWGSNPIRTLAPTETA